MTNPFYNESNSRSEDWMFCRLLPNIFLFLFFGSLYKIGTIVTLIHCWDLDRLVFKRTPLKSVYSCLNVSRNRLPLQIHTKLLVNLPSHLRGGETQQQLQPPPPLQHQQQHQQQQQQQQQQQNLLFPVQTRDVSETIFAH